MKSDEFDRAAVLQYARQKYGTEPETLWVRYPGYAVLRHTENTKWYAAVMNVSRARLGLPGTGEADVLNVKCDPLLIGSYRGHTGFLPAYHMNKEKWLTVLLDGTVPAAEIIRLLEMSYELTLK